MEEEEVIVNTLEETGREIGIVIEVGDQRNRNLKKKDTGNEKTETLTGSEGMKETILGVMTEKTEMVKSQLRTTKTLEGTNHKEGQGADREVRANPHRMTDRRLKKEGQ